MALRPIDGERRNAGIRTETSADRAERQEIKALRADLQTMLDGWDAATNAQRFAWTKELIRITRKTLRLVF